MTKPRSRGSRQADVAREAGVSQSTVSMVLNGGGDLGRISVETQRRVLSAARRLRYTPSGPQRPPTGSRQTPLLLGVHTFEPIFPTSARDYYFEFLQGIEEQAATDGCNLVLFTAAEDEAGVRRIYRGGVNGLRQAAGSLLLGHHAHRDDLARLAADGYPFVYIGHREVPDAEICYVGGDYRAATGRMVDELVAAGHRSFAYLGEAVRYEPQVDRWEGFAAALERFGLPVPVPAFDRPEALTAQWLDGALAAGTTAVLVESVSLLRVLAAMIALRGLTIPEDLSVVLLVDDPSDDAGGRPWAALHTPRNAMGRRAVRLLSALLADPHGDYERQILLPCTHTLDGTTAPPRPDRR
ncbi:LacI family DNA-binding transcriptional regulator [Micromonospora krabiensis]|uniref:Transcriptional regulator, LacI family n=1 Tax=Micromonospora krabiensis TaxID=307121 RepID=A0A1C3MXZ9_9ACTN|nr:LacI family DNA-binding transcriptional regulator [Micromonospora krabiensis]SBV25210.1 transcriptional regulator, LacI family [Micromonospora krabiensis]